MKDYTIDKLGILCIQGMSRQRHVTLEVGKEYKISPPIPSWEDPNLGRHCIIESIIVCSDDGKDIVAKVRFTDDNQMEQVEPCFLIAVKPEGT